MKKKTFVIGLCISIALLIIGIALIANNGTPYLNCKYWIDHPWNDIDGYIYALEHIDRYARGYFGGIAMVVIGGIGFVALILNKIVKKNETVIREEAVNVLD